MAGKLIYCPHECQEFSRFGSCSHQQKEKIWKPRAKILKSPIGTTPPLLPRRSSLPVLPTESFSWASPNYLYNDDSLLDVHLEMVLHNLAMPEKTIKELLQTQSVDQKKRILRLNMTHKTQSVGEKSLTFIRKFSQVSPQNMTNDDLLDVMVGLRQINRSNLEEFVIGNGGLTKLSEALFRKVILVRRVDLETAFIENALKCLELLSRVPSGLQHLTEDDDVTLCLALAVRVVLPSHSSSVNIHEGEALTIPQLAINLLTKVGYSSNPKGPVKVHSALQRATLARNESVTFFYSMYRVLTKGVLNGENEAIRSRAGQFDFTIRIAYLRFFISIVEMPFPEKHWELRGTIIEEIRKLNIYESLAEVVQSPSPVMEAALKSEMITQMEVFKSVMDRRNTGEVPSANLGRTIHDSKVAVIPQAAVNLLKVVGAGAFGTVHLGQFRGANVAVKCLHRRAANTDTQKNTTKILLREAEILSLGQNHPNVVRFFGLCLEGDEVRLVFEFCELGSLEDVVVKSRAIPTLETVVTYAVQAAAGLSHLHSLHIIHRDIAARNFLVDSKNCVKVSDFGLSTVKTIHQGSTGNNVNPLKWAVPPESLRDRIYTTFSDTYMFGIFLWELYFQSRPFPDLDDFQAALKVINENLCPSVENDRGELVPGLVFIMRSCWQRQPERRPPLSVLVNSLQSLVLSGEETSSSTTTTVTEVGYDPWE